MMTHDRRMLLWNFLLLLTGCMEVDTQTECDPNARAGDTCTGEWICPATTLAASTGTYRLETRCEESLVRERTWIEPPIVSEPFSSCDPEAPIGAACTGEWSCPESVVEASTGTEHTQLGCRDERVVSERWIVPHEHEVDAGVQPTDGGPASPCTVVESEIVESSSDSCGRPSIVVDGDRMRVGFHYFPYRGVLATRANGVWSTDETAFGTDVGRVELAGDGALVYRNTGTVEIWDLHESPRLAQTLEGIHTAAQSRAIGVAGETFHVATTHTHIVDGSYQWSVHHASGAMGALSTRELLVSRGVRTYDLDLDELAHVSLLFEDEITNTLMIARGAATETVPLPADVEPYPYEAGPVMASYADGSTYLLLRRGIGNWGPLGRRYEQLVGVRSPSGSWELRSIAIDDPDPCAAITPVEGATCTIDRTTYGPEAAIVKGPSGPIVVLVQHRTRGELRYSCLEPAAGCVACRWWGEPERSHVLAISSNLSETPRPLAGGLLESAARFSAITAGGDVHVALADHDVAGDCSIRHVRIACGE